MGGLTTRPLEEEDRRWANALVAEHFGSTRVVTRGRLFETRALPGLVAVVDGAPAGFLLYREDVDGTELVALVAVRPRRGVATALVRAFEALARERAWPRAWLVTTNDNVGAQAFYAAVGWRLVAVHRDAVSRSRELKPEIPLTNDAGVPIADELEYERGL
ncbi:MAG: GNAT family N-acetyltransferase [Deltaproteobacteria bacterium]|nr:MAG: GNAT family N-acetyltransferase [Deltaproteobacteria bacterium]